MIVMVTFIQLQPITLTRNRMEQIQELFEILKSTPQLALYGLTIWCIYILAKLASVVFAVKIICQKAIEKWHDYKVKLIESKEKQSELKQLISEKNVELERVKLEYSKNQFTIDKEYGSIRRLAKRFDKMKIRDVEFDELIRLLDAVKSTNYIHQSDIDKAIKKLNS